MKHKIITISALLALSTLAIADDVVVVKSNNEKAELQLKNEPTMTIGDNITVTSGSTTVTFSADQRVVLFTKNSTNDPEKGDTNNDGKLTIDDVTKLVNLLLKKAE